MQVVEMLMMAVRKIFVPWGHQCPTRPLVSPAVFFAIRRHVLQWSSGCREGQRVASRGRPRRLPYMIHAMPSSRRAAEKRSLPETRRLAGPILGEFYESPPRPELQQLFPRSIGWTLFTTGGIAQAWQLSRSLLGSGPRKGGGQ